MLIDALRLGCSITTNHHAMCSVSKQRKAAELAAVHVHWHQMVKRRNKWCNETFMSNDIHWTKAWNNFCFSFSTKWTAIVLSWPIPLAATVQIYNLNQLLRLSRQCPSTCLHFYNFFSTSYQSVVVRHFFMNNLGRISFRNEQQQHQKNIYRGVNQGMGVKVSS